MNSNSVGLIDEIDTKRLAKLVKMYLKYYKISQTEFAQKVLGRSVATVSCLLSRPKPWNRLRAKRNLYRQMWSWVQDRKIERISTQNAQPAYNATDGFDAHGEIKSYPECGQPIIPISQITNHELNENSQRNHELMTPLRHQIQPSSNDLSDYQKQIFEYQKLAFLNYQWQVAQNSFQIDPRSFYTYPNPHMLNENLQHFPDFYRQLVPVNYQLQNTHALSNYSQQYPDSYYQSFPMNSHVQATNYDHNEVPQNALNYYNLPNFMSPPPYMSSEYQQISPQTYYNFAHAQ